jgi:membrane protease YdiL (CAAX protease family)
MQSGDRLAHRRRTVFCPGGRAAKHPGLLGVSVLALSGVLLTYNNLVAGFIPSAWYVPANVAVAAAVWAAARRSGITGGDLGLIVRHVSTGWRWGAVAAAAALLVLAVTLSVPVLRPALEDERVADIGYGVLAYRALVRIPIGTALLEEFAFRGALFGAWRRRWGTAAAVAGSSFIFGLWHIRPTLELTSTNGFADSGPGRVAAVAAAVVLTTAGGALFAWLRLRSRSLVAPLVAHTGINSLALIAAFIALRL